MSRARRLRRLLPTLIGALALFAITAVGARDWAARAMVRAPNALRAPRASPALPEGAREELTLEVGPPRASIRAWLFDPPDGDARGTLLLFHGLADDRRSTGSGARGFARHGWRVIVPDLRGHGTSSGARLGFGGVEGRDALQLVQHLEARGDLALPLAAYGRSYGGAVALQLAAREPRVVAVAAVATFASLERLPQAYAEQSWPWLAWALPDAALASLSSHAAEVGGFALEDADAEGATARASADVLLLHGDADAVVPFAHAERLHAACQGRGCTLVRLAGATHDDVLRDVEVGRQARRFLRGYLER